MRREFGRVDVVLHQGACSDTMEQNGRLMLESNYRCSRNLLDACQAQGTRLLYASIRGHLRRQRHVSRAARIRAAAECLRLFKAAV